MQDLTPLDAGHPAPSPTANPCAHLTTEQAASRPIIRASPARSDGKVRTCARLFDDP